ncbi:polysaccharide export protein [Rubellimicrobium rubrum]|uniref:Polysaccharide export protein n=1 Tax=Rubellimicrobium rubrum TaxID=2585369 RepID=A0A5C4MVH7_9RHOB|nr:polysaccharide biosynthesis/export family protein [Rubellimicrobium rubrum]TNC48506.1 polysaccharide export protein [Rubellimicrobium rubrum]
MSKNVFRLGLGALVCAALTGCALPRGAAFESEVLRARSESGGEAVRDFAVEGVTRDALARFASWPIPAEEQLGWIGRQDGPANRIIAAGDVLAITLWNTEDNSLLTAPGQRAITMEAVTVSSTGEVFMPYIGDIRVAGMSPDHARDAIEARFIEVTPSAQVQLEVAESRGTLVNLVGGVDRPGAYPMRDQSYTVLSLIAEGGGVPPNMNNPQIRLMRGDAIYGTSIDRLYSEPGLDTTLRPGDKVIVEPDERFFLSLGAAGSEAVHPFPRDEISALEAISIIGGVTDSRANPRGILVLREYPASAVRADGTGPAQERVVFTLDLTTADGLFSAGEFPIQAGDLVYATESRVTSAQTVFSILGSTVGLANRVGNLSN